jgi:hypothetical protein
MAFFKQISLSVTKVVQMLVAGKVSNGKLLTSILQGKFGLISLHPLGRKIKN